MNDGQQSRNGKKIFMSVVLAVILAGLLGWTMGSNQNKANNNQPNTSEPTATQNTDGPDVKSIVSYELPDGWKEASCPSAPGAVLVVPRGAGEVDCNASPSSPVKISVDSANNTDCNQLQGVQNVSKHICISEFINGKKSLKAETRYNAQSSYKRDTTIHAYYINTGKGVVKVEYVYNEDNAHQMGWEELAKSVAVKN